MTEQNKKTYTPEFKKEACTAGNRTRLQGNRGRPELRNQSQRPGPVEKPVDLRGDQRLPG